MRRSYFIFILVLLITISTNVFAACGDINQVSVDVGTIKKDGKNYIIYVPVGAKSVNISASASGDWVKGYGPRTLSTGNVTKLMVDGSTCGGGTYTYQISFQQTDEVIAANTTTTAENTASTQSANTESNNGTASTKNEIFLSSLKIEGYEIKFDKNVDLYTIKVKNDVKRVDIEAVAEDKTAKVDISDNAKALEEGENKILINLVNSENKKGQYIIVVDREKTLDDNAYLADIKIDGHLLTFDRDTTEYNLEIGNETALNIVPVTESKKAEATVKGNEDLTDGSKITITVKAEDGTKRDYVINISKKFNIFDYWIYPAIGGLIFLLLILLIIRKRRKKKKAKKEKKSSEKETKTKKDSEKSAESDSEVFKL